MVCAFVCHLCLCVRVLSILSVCTYVRESMVGGWNSIYQTCREIFSPFGMVSVIVPDTLSAVTDLFIHIFLERNETNA